MDGQVTHDNITGLQASQNERLDERDAFMDNTDRDKAAPPDAKINNTAGENSMDTDAKMKEI